MKTLYLVRHAKSSWQQTNTADIDRPLNKRGFHDAPKMAQCLAEQGVKLDLLMSSPALRATSTAKYFAETFNIGLEDIVIEQGLYDYDMLGLLGIIHNIEHTIDHVMIIGHNPNLTLISNLLCEYVIENIPTCGVVAISFDLSHWGAVDEHTGKKLFFNYPNKDHHHS